MSEAPHARLRKRVCAQRKEGFRQEEGGPAPLPDSEGTPAGPLGTPSTPGTGLGRVGTRGQ